MERKQKAWTERQLDLVKLFVFQDTSMTNAEKIRFLADKFGRTEASVHTKFYEIQKEGEQNVTEWEDHEAQLEGDYMKDCLRAALDAGHSTEDAEYCNDGELKCPECPWREEAK